MGKVSATMNVEMRLEAGRVVVGIGLRNYKCSLGEDGPGLLQHCSKGEPGRGI